MKRILCSLLVWYGLLLCGQNNANLRIYGVEEGLSQKNVHCILQDDKGFIWLSTWNGLERFDGYNFENYKAYPNKQVRISNYRFTQLQKSSLNNIWCIAYDNRCYLFNTDNYCYEDLSLYNSLFEHNISRIFPLDNGITWLVSNEKVYRVDEKKLPAPEAIQFFGEKDGIGKQIYSIHQDRWGQEWVLSNNGTTQIKELIISNYNQFNHWVENNHHVYLANSNGFFARYEHKGESIVPYVGEKELKKIELLYVLHDQRILIVMRNGIALFDEYDESFLFYDHELGSNLSCYQDAHNRIWFMKNQGGIDCFDLESGRFSSMDYPKVTQNALNSNLRFAFEDSYGCLWIKAHDGELSYFDQATQRLEQAFLVSQGEKTSLEIRSINYLIDQQKNLWFSDKNGLAHLYFQSPKAKLIPSHTNADVRALAEDHQNRLWVGVKNNLHEDDGIVSLYNETNQWIGNLSKEGKIIADENVVFGNDVYCITEDNRHRIWLGTKKGGLFVLEQESENSYKLYHYLHEKEQAYSLSSNLIYAIQQDSKGNIWLGCYGGGLNLVDDSHGVDQLRFIHFDNRLKNYPMHMGNEIRCLYETSDGCMLIGTTKGLFSFSTYFDKPETIRFYHNYCNERPESLSHNDIYHIEQDRNGRLYVALLSGGVCSTADNLLSNNVAFQHCNALYRDVPDLVLGLVNDSEGNLWFASENQLSRFNHHMVLMDEIRHLSLTEAAPLLRQSGELVFGSTFGFVSISPEIEQRHLYVPPISFVQIEIFTADSSRRQRLTKQEEVRLKPNERNCLITFSAIDYNDTHSIEYAYRLLGLNEQWISLGKNHYANLNNLPVGEYVFQVKSTNSNNLWVDNVTNLSIHIQPKFHETLGAKLLFGLLGLGFVSLFFVYLSRMLFLRRKVESEQELNNIKLRFFTDISHELRTPLSLISGPIEELQHERISQHGQENIRLIQRNVQRMLRLINQILDFRKIQDGKMKVYVERLDAIPLIRRIYESFQPMAQKQELCFDFECQTESCYLYTDIDKLEKIVYNLLSNAFKYTPKGKHIWLKVESDADELVVMVKDEGKGISEKKLHRLFARFDTLDEANPSISTGIGLSLVNELVTLLHGSIRVESKEGQGCLFVVHMPGDFDTFKDDENADFILSSESEDKPSEPTKNQVGESEKKLPHKERILVVEDNEELRHFMRSILEGSYEVLEAENGRIALEQTLKWLPDLVISDIMMPEMDGIDYLKSVRNQVSVSHTPIVLLSAKASVNDQVEGLSYGADDYLTKPFSSSLLKAKISSLLERRKCLYDYYLSGLGATNQSLPSPSALDTASPSTPQVTDYDKEFIDLLIRSIEENFQNPDFRIDDLADQINMSRTVFYRKVKSLMGIPPIDFVNRMRIKRSLQLIEQGAKSLSEVGYLCGFSTPQYFTRVFKKIVGCSPKEFKERTQTGN